MPTSILFVCIHNSARSQMAEAFANRLGAPGVVAESAGIEPGSLNPLVVAAMREIGIDISGNATKSVAAFLEAGRRFNYVITVCDETSGERCPLFPGAAARIHWNFPDPSGFTGSDEERLVRTREVRDAINERIAEFLGELRRGAAPSPPTNAG